MNLISPQIETYAAKHSSPESSLLRRLVKETYAKTEIPQMQVGHLEGLFLKLLVQITKAKRVLEIGTFTGYSSLSMAQGLPKNGRLYTLDIDPKATAIAKRYWANSIGADRIQLLLGPALQSIQKIRGPLDLVFIDADKGNYLNYWNACLPKVRKGGLLIVDNVLWSGRVLKPQSETDRAIDQFNKTIRKDPRVELVMLTVRDGMTLARKE